MNISDINTYDSDFLLKMRLICERRGVKLKNVESVAFSVLLAFGLPDLTAILPATANTFYYINRMKYVVQVSQVTANVYFTITNSGQGSAGTVALTTLAAIASSDSYLGLETNSLVYNVNANTAGVLNLFGEVFKITTAP